MNDVHAMTTLLRYARLVLPDQTIESADLFIQDGRIARVFVSSSDDSIKADSVIDLDGCTLFPGFIDAHLHGAVGVDINNTDSQGLHRVARFLAQHGVTAWLPTLVPDSEDNYQKSISAIDELIGSQDQREPAARVLGVHYEGPFVSQQQCGALRSQFFKTFAGEELKSVPWLQAPGAVQLITVAPEIEGGLELVKELVKRGWIVSIGHTSATVETLDQAFAAGAHHMTHFMNAMAPLHHRAPGPIAWGLMRDDVTCDVIADDRHIDPFVLGLLLKLKRPDRITLISDAIAATGLGDGVYRIWGETINVKDGRTSNARGSIAGSVITLLDAAQTVRSLGVLEVDIARMASFNPARLLGVDADCGSIEAEKRADLVALDQSGNVRLTIIGGKVAFRSEPPAVAGGPSRNER